MSEAKSHKTTKSKISICLLYLLGSLIPLYATVYTVPSVFSQQEPTFQDIQPYNTTLARQKLLYNIEKALASQSISKENRYIALNYLIKENPLPLANTKNSETTKLPHYATSSPAFIQIAKSAITYSKNPPVTYICLPLKIGTTTSHSSTHQQPVSLSKPTYKP